jgi:hypothetical protein
MISRRDIFSRKDRDVNFFNRISLNVAPASAVILNVLAKHAPMHTSLEHVASC